MKNLQKWTSIITIILFLFAGNARADANNINYYPPSREITYQQFYNDLSPYGNWINDPQYGYVWSPYESDFQPYRSNGNWAHTRYGWTWVSGYDWGWAPFHYGRWTMDPYYGWLWIPGYEWAPAWVNWRGGGDYYGWAPMGPGYGYNISLNSWNFVPSRYIYSPRLYNYYVRPSRNVVIINNTTIINNNVTVNNGNKGPRRTYNTGPSVREVEQVTNARVRTLDVVQSNRPGAASLNSKAIRMYRPAVEKVDNQNLVIRPVKSIELSDAEQKEVIAMRRSTIAKADLKPESGNRPTAGLRELKGAERNLNANAENGNARTFQDNGIRNSSIDRRQLSPVNSEINNSPSRKMNPAVENRLPSRNINPAYQESPLRSNDLERSADVQDKSNLPVRQTPFSRNENIDRQMPTARELPQAREMPQERTEAPQARPDAPVRESQQAREAPVRRVLPVREAPQPRQEIPIREAQEAREAPVRRVAPVREVPVRQEHIRNIPSRENNMERNLESPRRIIRN